APRRSVTMVIANLAAAHEAVLPVVTQHQRTRSRRRAREKPLRAPHENLIPYVVAVTPYSPDPIVLAAKTRVDEVEARLVGTDSPLHSGNRNKRKAATHVLAGIVTLRVINARGPKPVLPATALFVAHPDINRPRVVLRQAPRLIVVLELPAKTNVQ